MLHKMNFIKQTKNKFGKRQKSFRESGQTLIIIVFVMVLALATGISVSSRFIKNLRSTTRTQTGYRSGAVAEAVLERILLKSSDELQDYINYGSCGADCTLSITNSDGVIETANVTLTQLGNSSDPFVLHITQDQSSEINLSGYDDDTDVTICWNDPSSGEYPSIVGMLIHGTLGNYEASSFAYNSAASTQNNNFYTASAANGYQNCFSVDSQSDPEMIRLRALYQDIDVTVIPDSGSVIPSQGILIESEGHVLDTNTKVSAIKGTNATPYIFDYVLFSKSESNPLAN